MGVCTDKDLAIDTQYISIYLEFLSLLTSYKAPKTLLQNNDSSSSKTNQMCTNYEHVLSL